MWHTKMATPDLVVALGSRVADYLHHLSNLSLIPILRRPLEQIDHYSYIALRPDNSRRLAPYALGPMNPIRLADYDRQFARIAEIFRELKGSKQD
jgi:hypothetical protein